MHLQPKRMLCFLIQATLLEFLCLPCFICEKEDEYATCFKPFRCGRLSNISYPFWGGTRSLSCGYPGFQLDCNGDVPLLNISSISYGVLHIDFHTYTLRVARQDLWNNTCPGVLRKTVLDPVYFKFSSNFGDRNITLYYGCPASWGLSDQFNCDVYGITTVNVFSASSRGLGVNTTCKGNITVPVNRMAAAALENQTDSSIHVLQEALASGFSIQWYANNQNCENCRRSRGTCGFNQHTGAIACTARKAWTGLRAVAGAAGPSRPTSAPSEAPTPAPAGYDPSPAPVGIIVGVVLGSVFFLITCSVIVRFFFKRRPSPGRPSQGRRNAAEKFLFQNGSAPKIYKYSEIKKVTKSFSDKLGQGGYGSVYKGSLPDGTLVAVKVLMEADSDGEEFINEVATC